MPGFDAFNNGTIEYPDRSTTLVVEVARLTDAEDFGLSGPGIKTTKSLSAAPLPIDFADRMAANRALFPRGVDLILTCGATLVGLPRSVYLSSAVAQTRERA
jgi:alpha-D-ribose 1-methylphosphonate 5-triphosphate synthase subunit PhnH